MSRFFLLAIFGSVGRIGSFRDKPLVDLASCKMWNCASSYIAGSIGLKNDVRKPTQDSVDCSDDEASSVTSREEGLECPICWESFNLVENIPYGNLKFPRKNFFLLWMLESMNGDRVKSHSTVCGDHQGVCPSSTKSPGSYTGNNLRRGEYIHHSEPSGSSNHDGNHFTGYFAIERLHMSLKKSLVFFVHLTAKFPLVILFLLIILYAIPASAAILALYILITVVFALPSFLILYFAYPSLDWLVREIIT
ncbi:hypothetical protein DH2020_037387 [Rehmannia glutinosa]|uniref:Uncharacterized protein n=1 Tax=Rehmannia glutinosa TaxID=99300 RepID=A0ABR0V1J4_REHGL